MHAFLSSADFFAKSTFLKNSFRNTIRVSNSSNPDQVGPDLGPNCLQRLSADDTSRQSRAYPGSEFVVANTLAKWKKLEPNEINFSQRFNQKVVSTSCFVF